MRSIVPLVLLLTASLAGCSDDDGDGMDPGTGGSAQHGEHLGQDSATHLLAPTWELGQWWTWTSEQSSAPFTYVVSKDAGQDWILDTDSPDIAFFDARSDISLLGQVRKSDLAGSQGSQRVEFFQFPLAAGKNWTTTWDTLPMKVEVTSVADGLAVLAARHQNGTPYATYSYDAKTGYFRETTFYEADGTTVQFAAKVTSSGKAFSGDLVRWSIEVVLEKGGDLPPADAGTFSVDPEATDIYAEASLDCSVGFATVAIGIVAGANAGAGYGLPGSPCPVSQRFAGSVAAVEDGDTWGYAIQSTGVQGTAPAGTFSLQAWQRTLATFAVGQAP